jgi:hypothetical protein
MPKPAKPSSKKSPSATPATKTAPARTYKRTTKVQEPPAIKAGKKQAKAVNKALKKSKGDPFDIPGYKAGRGTE